MRTVTNRATLLWIALVFLVLPGVRAADSFYLDLLEQGALDYAVEDFEPAARKLRIACFGLLDEPELLAEGLVRLSLAEMGLGDRQAVSQSFRRLLETETRFGAYSGLRNRLELRDEFERQLPHWVEDAALARAPVFAELLARSRKEELESLPAPSRRKELARRLQQDPGDAETLIDLTELDANEGRTRQARKRLNRILATDANHQGALCARGRLALVSSDCERALADLPACSRPLSGGGLATYELCLEQAAESEAIAQVIEGQPELRATDSSPQEPPPVETETAGVITVSEPEAITQLPQTALEPSVSPPKLETPPATLDEGSAASEDPAEPEPEAVPADAPTPTADLVETEDPANAVKAWARAWSEQRTDDYLSFYSDDFAPSGGLTRRDWADQRRWSLAQPQYIKVSIANLSTIVDEDQTSATFLQDYESDRFRDRVRKTLDLRLEAAEWKIVRERSNPENAGESLETDQPPSQETRLDQTDDPATAVLAWAGAWSEQNADDYLFFYSVDFAPSGGLTRRDWAEQRRQKLAQPRYIKVSLAIVSTLVDGDRASVTFSQDYESDQFRDRVNKILELRLEEGQWKIVRESTNP